MRLRLLRLAAKLLGLSLLIEHREFGKVTAVLLASDYYAAHEMFLRVVEGAEIEAVTELAREMDGLEDWPPHGTVQ